MRSVSRATALLASAAILWGCTGGQSGTETPAAKAGSGGAMPVRMVAGTGEGAEGGRESAGSGGEAGAGTGGSMVAGATRGGTGGVGAGATPNGVKQAGSGAAGDGFAPNASADGSVCACSLAGRAALLRARLLAFDACSVRAQVEEVLALPANFSTAIAAGDEIEARRSKRCGEVPSLAADDTALIMYVPPATGTGAGEALVASWSDPLVFGQPAVGEPIELPRSDQAKLLEPATCASGFGPAAKGAQSAPCN